MNRKNCVSNNEIGNCEMVEVKLLEKLKEAEEIVKDENAWMSLAELKAFVGIIL